MIGACTEKFCDGLPATGLRIRRNGRASSKKSDGSAEKEEIRPESVGGVGVAGEADWDKGQKGREKLGRVAEGEEG